MGISQSHKRSLRGRLLGAWLILAAMTSLAGAQRAAEPKGRLKIEGTHITKLVLAREDGHTEEWKNLDDTLEIPVGTYHVRQLTLKDEYACRPDSLEALGPIEVCQTEPALLKAGAPLRQSITTKRRGGLLVLTYHVHGIGGEEYEPASTGRARFVISRGDKPIVSDGFTYT